MAAAGCGRGGGQGGGVPGARLQPRRRGLLAQERGLPAVHRCGRGGGRKRVGVGVGVGGRGVCV